MAYYWAHPSYVHEEKSRSRTKVSSGNVSPEVARAMCKKIAQLTKVICNLNTQIEDKDLLIESMKKEHEEKLQRVFGESRSKITKLEKKELQLKEQIEGLETELYKVRLLPKNLPYYSDVNKIESGSLSGSFSLLNLTEKLEATRSNLQETLNDFEALHKDISLSNNKDNSSCYVVSPSKLQDDKDIPKRNIQALKNLCDTLEKENTLLVQKYATQLNVIRKQYEEILLEVQRLKLNNSNECNGTTFIKDLANSEVCFKKRLTELLLQLSDSEEQSERHQRKVLHLKEVLARKDKEAEAMREEIERLKQFQRDTDHLKQNEVQCSEKTISTKEKVEDNYQSLTAEDKNAKDEELLSDELSANGKEDMSSEETKSDTAFGRSDESNPNSPTESTAEKEISCSNSRGGTKKSKKEDLAKALREWRRKYKEAVKNHQAELKKKDLHLNKVWKEKMISKEKELKELLSKEKMAAIDEIIVQKAMDFEKAQKDWQNTVGHLLKQLTHLQNMLESSEERRGESEEKELSGIENELTEFKIQQQYYEDTYKQQLYTQENILDEKHKLVLSKQEEMFKEREEEIRKQHIAELTAQEEANKINLEKIKLENEHKRMEEKAKLEQLHQSQCDALQEKLKKEKARALEEQEKIFLAEIKLMQSQLDDLVEKIHQKDEDSFQAERQLKKELMALKSEESKLHATIKVLQSELNDVTKELELKRNEVLCVRKEATQQIKNLENYWQNRLAKEAKKIEQDNREEKQNMLHNFLKAQDMLKDKIFVLKSRLQSAEHFINHKALVDDVGNTRFQKKEAKENGLKNFKLKEGKRAMSLELLNQEKSKPSYIDSRAVLGIQKTVYERTILKPLCSPLLLRRHSTTNMDNRKLSRSQSPTSAPVHRSSAVSARVGLRATDKRASWSGENIPSILLEDYSDSQLNSSMQNLAKATSCVDLPLMSSSAFVPFNPLKSATILTGHVCKPILECEEPLSISENEDQSQLYTMQNGDITYQKHEFCEKLPLLESEL